MNGEAPAEFAALCLAPAFDETVAPGAVLVEGFMGTDANLVVTGK